MTSNRRPGARIVTGLLAGVTTAVLSGCTTAAVPLGSPAVPSLSPTPSVSTPSYVAATGPHEPRGDNDFVEGANDSDGAEHPTFTDAELSDQVLRVTEEFVATWVDRGYPQRTDASSRARIESAMTTRGFARLKIARGDESSDAYERRSRTRAKLTSVEPSIRAQDRATAKVEYHVLTQQLRGGTWRTVSTSATQVRTLTLVDEPGAGWLVDSVT